MRVISLEDPVLLRKLLGRAEDRFALVPEICTPKRLLITGAAGTVGGALVRQISAFAPERIVAVDHTETRLTELMQDLLPDRLRSFIPVLADIRDRTRMAALFRQHRPHVVLHTAALKHVAELETRVLDSIETNTLATIGLVREAECQGVERFVSMSTDKAVYPASIMGASKRAAELLLAAGTSSGMRVASFRCGNILASSGSVLRIWLERIASGVPIPLTDLRAERYFVTLHEVSSALLQIATLAADHPLLVYNLRAPVLISELAARLFDALGLELPPEFHLTGLMAGEKLVEELHYADEQLEPTCSPHILAVKKSGKHSSLDSDAADEVVAALSHACRRRDLRGTMYLIQKLIPTYRPSALVTEQLAA